MQKELAPEFTLPTLTGDTLSLRDLRGKAVLLSFWVTWCPSCQVDLPQKERFFRSLDADHFAFYTINVTGREADPSQVEPFVHEHGFHFPVLLDQGRTVYDAFQIQSVPTSVLIDPNGRIVGRYDEQVPFLHIVEVIGNLI
ncbi:TlpA disulfide reductase family protein [Marininema halotolerans]|uniref:Peroxiredoxin n=1 Tax=Marininema halotolerans TaxID=1155944 RepID=A0A1I6RF24_9BACL|nr:TlpA disulfide reductase family protein [Marininema halotolerans]SFS63351.1 Peroxiredoxin [Marininema halotolerans]